MLLLVVITCSILPFAALVTLWLLVRFSPTPVRDKQFFLKKRLRFKPSNINDGEFIAYEDDATAYFPCLLKNLERDTPRYTEPELELTVIVPAFNEEDRLPAMLDECLMYLEKRTQTNPNFTYELIVVDDGSWDQTARVASKYQATSGSIRILRLENNCGKGGAVRCGVLCARGRFILFVDADGATKFYEFEKLEHEMRRLCNGENINQEEPIDWTHPAVVVGSRAHLEKESIAQRSFFRTFLMYGFHMLVFLFTVRSVQDTQCGFKLFSRAAASELFVKLHVEEWAFDVELLYLAEKLNFGLTEVPVEWYEKDGSKVAPFISWFQMGRDIILIWFRYKVGIWKIDEL